MVNHQAQVTALTYCDNLLLVGTQGGYLLIFNIHQKVHSRTRRSSASVTISSLPTSPKFSRASTSNRKSSQGVDYNLVAATHGCTHPVVSIHPIGQQGSLCLSSPQSPVLSTPANHPVNILVIFGSGETSLGGSSQSRVHLYEMTGGSPLESPLNSPQGTIGGRGSARSSQSLPAGSLRRCSLHDLKILPELTLHRVTKGSVSYLPLQEQSS